MRVTILTFGSLGDVQPYVALGTGLATAGHQVRLASHATYEKLACDHQLGFASLVGDPHEILDSEEGRRWQGSGRSPLRYARRFLRVSKPLLRQAVAQSLDVCEDADAVVVSVLGLLTGRHVAEKLGLPLVIAPYAPLNGTAAFPSPLSPYQAGFGPVFNRSTHLLATQVMWQPLRRSTNEARCEVLGLPPLPFSGLAREIREQRWPTLYGYSPAVVARPPEWGERIHVTGYWFLDRPAGWAPPADLVAFLAAGPPPVYVGFGSMHPPDRDEITRIVLRALAETGNRGVLLTGPGALGRVALPEDVFGIASCPFDWLFPQMSAVVHHGGAGTTAAGLHAGKPSVVLPSFADQWFWGWRVSQLGTGPPAIPFRRLTVHRLAAAIRAATTRPDLRWRAAALGERIRAEAGVRQAVTAFERCLT